MNEQSANFAPNANYAPNATSVPAGAPANQPAAQQMGQVAVNAMPANAATQGAYVGAQVNQPAAQQVAGYGQATPSAATVAGAPYGASATAAASGVSATAAPAAATVGAPAAAFAGASTGAAAAAARPLNDHLPSRDGLREELTKERQRNLFVRVLRSTVLSLVVVAAVAVIVVTLVLPILQISGTSMTNTLYDQDIVVALRGSACQTGDIIAFYYNNKILVKRVIAKSGQWVDIDESGNVYVDGTMLDEPYVSDKALGDCNIKLPYQVPESRIFVMGDHRSISVDSRSTTVGCVADEQIVGKLVFCAWPLEQFGLVA